MRSATWRPRALDQLDSLIGYITERDEAAARRIEGLVQHSVETLCGVPFAGRPGRVAGAREWGVHPNYILIYKVTRTRIAIVRFLHARQRYP